MNYKELHKWIKNKHFLIFSNLFYLINRETKAEGISFAKLFNLEEIKDLILPKFIEMLDIKLKFYQDLK